MKKVWPSLLSFNWSIGLITQTCLNWLTINLFLWSCTHAHCSWVTSNGNSNLIARWSWYLVEILLACQIRLLLSSCKCLCFTFAWQINIKFALHFIQTNSSILTIWCLDQTIESIWLFFKLICNKVEGLLFLKLFLDERLKLVHVETTFVVFSYFQLQWWWICESHVNLLGQCSISDLVRVNDGSHWLLIGEVLCISLWVNNVLLWNTSLSTYLLNEGTHVYISLRPLFKICLQGIILLTIKLIKHESSFFLFQNWLGAVDWRDQYNLWVWFQCLHFLNETSISFREVIWGELCLVKRFFATKHSNNDIWVGRLELSVFT